MSKLRWEYLSDIGEAIVRLEKKLDLVLESEKENQKLKARVLSLEQELGYKEYGN